MIKHVITEMQSKQHKLTNPNQYKIDGITTKWNRAVCMTRIGILKDMIG